MLYRYTKLFTGGLLKGLQYTLVSSVKFEANKEYGEVGTPGKFIIVKKQKLPKNFKRIPSPAPRMAN